MLFEARELSHSEHQLFQSIDSEALIFELPEIKNDFCFWPVGGGALEQCDSGILEHSTFQFVKVRAIRSSEMAIFLRKSVRIIFGVDSAY